ncbi:glycosyltransferase [Clostridium perfringens]|nr:glycosyltransferase [Clostridium perfringens]
MRKKLAIVVPSLNGGGAERVIINLIRNLDRSKFDIRLILIKKQGVYVNLIPNDVSVVDLNSDRVRYSIFKLVKELKKIKPDTILSTLGHLNLVLLAIRPFIRKDTKILIREANTPSKSISELSNNKRKFFLKLYKYLYPKADLIIAQCEDMKNDIIECLKVDEKKIKYIYNPLDINKILINKERENPYDRNKINLISVGRLSYQKGFDILLDAFKIVNEKFLNTHLTILGDGELKDDLQNQAKRLNIDDKVSFVGFKENPYPYYYYSDMYVLSSRWEGFPNSLLEALACETKVVAVNCKSGPKEILCDNQYGILVDEENAKSLADGIIKYIPQKNKTGNRACFFDINKIIKEYEEVLIL